MKRWLIIAIIFLIALNLYQFNQRRYLKDEMRIQRLDAKIYLNGVINELNRIHDNDRHAIVRHCKKMMGDGGEDVEQ